MKSKRDMDIAQSHACKLSGGVVELPIHAIRDFPFSSGVSKSVVPTRGWDKFFYWQEGWKLPEVLWAKVNVYGSVASHIPRAVIGKVVETRVVLEGLKLAWDRGFSQIELECDNSMLIELIRNGWVTVSNVDAIRGIHGWCLKSWEVKFRHIQREANRVVDCIAKVD
ncbi:hypothetical protein Gotri_018837 [Gossypium trilobum]|uniref:RNase H type-1 domain-containing protein n=1 Tax=Gossypium trilobum TaxID=34281 RepID=A0A7J9EAX0_9ROSI|nr:hypothetical protein [Gossypium trilobum]